MRLSLLCLLGVALLFVSCNKKKGENGVVEMYTLKSYALVAGKCQVDAATATLETQAFVTNDDILSYSPTNHRYKLSANAFQRVKAFGLFVPFAVTVNHQPVYYAIFKPGISSSSCDHSITMDVDHSISNAIVMKLGYPGLPQGVTIDDQRNNTKLISALAIQSKLE